MEEKILIIKMDDFSELTEHLSNGWVIKGISASTLSSKQSTLYVWIQKDNHRKLLNE